MPQTTPLNPQQHGQLRLRDEIDAGRFGQQQLLPLVVHEFAQAGVDAPVVFIKNADTGQFKPVQLLGLAQRENLLFQDGQWQGTYIPGVLRLDPLRLIPTAPDSDQLAIAVEGDSPLLSETEGERLFDEQGEPTQFLAGRRDALGQYFEHGQVTDVFLGRLAELGLLHTQELVVDLRGEKGKLSGIYLVNEQALRELSDEIQLELVRRGFMQAIHSHLMSLHLVKRLAKIKLDAADQQGAGQA